MTMGMKTLLVIVLCMCLLMHMQPAHAKTELKLPRFVSLKTNEANVRNGPGLQYQIKWVLKRKFIPLEVIAEFEQWRKIRDVDGDQGWVHRAMLSSKRTTLILGETQTIREYPTFSSLPIAKL